MTSYLEFLDESLRDDLPGTEERWHRLPFADVRTVVWPRAGATCRVLALHGAGGNADALASIAALAHRAGAEVVVPDLPGYGRTRPDRPGRVTYEHWVATGTALAALDARPLVVVGLSIGGMLAYDVAAASQRVSGVVATCLLDPSRADVRTAVARVSVLGRIGPALLSWSRYLLDPVAVPIGWTGDMRKIANDPQLVRRCLADRTGAGARIPLGFLRTWMTSRRPVEPEQFTACPVVLAHPAEDRWTPPALSTAFLDRIAAPTEFVLLGGAGHFPVEQPGIGQLADVLKRVVSAT